MYDLFILPVLLVSLTNSFMVYSVFKIIKKKNDSSQKAASSLSVEKLGCGFSHITDIAWTIEVAIPLVSSNNLVY